MKKLLAIVFFLFLLVIIYLANIEELESVYKTFGVYEFMHSIPFKDKLGHIVLYGFWAFLLNLAFYFKNIKVGSVYVQVGALIAFVFAIGEEFTQLGIPTRNFDYIDMLADLLGIGFFTFLSLRLKSKKIKLAV